MSIRNPVAHAAIPCSSLIIFTTLSRAMPLSPRLIIPIISSNTIT